MGDGTVTGVASAEKRVAMALHGNNQTTAA